LFNFVVNNTADAPLISSIGSSGQNYVWTSLNRTLIVMEDDTVEIYYLHVYDDDLAINSSQKSRSYNESLNLTTIFFNSSDSQVPGFFNFTSPILSSQFLNWTRYSANFIREKEMLEIIPWSCSSLIGLVLMIHLS